MSQFKPGTYDINGIPFAALLNQDVRKSSNIPNFHGDKAAAAQNRAGVIKAPKQSTPQTFKKALSMKINNRINSTEARHSKTLNSNMEVAKTGINTNVAGIILTVSKKQQKKKITGSTRRRLERLLKVGIPHDEARSLCRLPWIVLEKMLLNNTHKIWYNNSGDPQGPAKKYVKVSAGIDVQNSDVGPGREASNIPNFHGYKDTVAQNTAGVTRAPNQCTQQAFTKESLSGMNNEMNYGKNSTEARYSGLLNSNIEVARTDGINTNVSDTTNTEHDRNWKKLSRASRKKFNKLKERGIPENEAQNLCNLPWTTIEEMLLKHPWKRNHSEEPQGPANKNLKMSTTDELNIDIPFRVGITNSKPMSEDQMKMLQQHLILAIKDQCSHGEGPVFLGFSHKAGWVLVTCANQRSKEWLVHETTYLEPWPAALLSIIPEDELPKPPTAVTMIPEAEAATVEEAMRLLKTQNQGLNTELWKVRFEKVENGVRKVSFTLDDPSADVLRAQNCQAAISFTKVSFKIKGQYRPYPPDQTQSKVLGTSKQGSQSLGGKSSDQTTSKVGPSSAAKGRQLPQATGRVIQPILQDPKPSSKKNPFAQGSGGIIREEPAALAVGRSVPQTRIEFGAPLNPPLLHSTMKNPQGHGTFAQKDQRQPVIGEPLTSARGLLPQAAMDMAVQPIQDSQIGPPFTQGSGRAGGILFGSDGSVLATRARPSQRADSKSHSMSSFGQSSLTKRSREGLTETSQADFPAILYPPSVGRTSNLGGMGAATVTNNGFLGPSQASSGFGAQPIIRDSPFGTMFDQVHREVDRTASDHDSVLTNQVPSQLEVPSMQNLQSGDEAFGQSDVVDLTETDNELSDSHEAAGGYHSWVIEDLESYGRRFTQNIPGTGALSSATGPSEASYRDQCFDEFAHGCTGRSPHPEITLDRGFPQPNGASGARIIGSESQGKFQDGRTRTVDEQESMRRGLLPQLSGGFKCIELDNHRRPSQGSRGIYRESMPDRGAHEARGFGASVQKPESPFQGRGILTDEESRRIGMLPHPSDLQSRPIIESKSHGKFQDGGFECTELDYHRKPLQGSRGIDREAMPDRGSHEARGFRASVQKPKSPFERRGILADEESRCIGLFSHPSDFESRSIETESHGKFQDGRGENKQESKLLPHPRGGFESTEFDNHRRPLQGSRGIDREAMPDRGSHEARGFGASVQKSESPFQSRGILTDDESTRIGMFPHPSDLQSRSIKSGSHGRSFQDKREIVTDRQSRSHKEFLAQPSSFESRLIDSERTLSHRNRTVADRESRSNRRQDQASCYQGQELSHERLFRDGRKSRSDRQSPQERCNYDAWMIEEPERCGSRTTDWNGSTGLREDRSSRSGRQPRALTAREDSWTEQRAPW